MATEIDDMPKDVIVSAPGKVLFAGGFLVLDRQHTGLVFGLDARIHVHITRLTGDSPCEIESITQQNDKSVLISVESPQFLTTSWLYKATISESGDSTPAQLSLEQIVNDGGHGQWLRSPNKFAETALRYTLTYLLQTSRRLSQSIKLTILADTDYYSQTSDNRTARGSSRHERFIAFGTSLSDAHKTGLGSSAALVTAMVAGLTTYLGLIEGDAENPKLPLKRIHNLAQAAHCAAQGKVGSGFDVAAATYGSCLYRRFTPSVLELVGDSSAEGFATQLHLCVDDLELHHKWDVEIGSHAVKIPESLLLLMCDVDCGSETPGMVRKVLEWRKEKPQEAALLWAALQQGQEELCGELARLTDMDGIGANDYTNLGDILATIRSFVREMSVKSQVPIEPPVITELLDFCTSQPGVVGGMAPGAGGYDAVALLVENDPQVVDSLQACLQGWKSPNKDGAVIGKVRLLGVKQEADGVKIMQDSSIYSPWLNSS